MINDSDGSSEFHKVHLTPSNWYVLSFHRSTFLDPIEPEHLDRAWLAQMKAQGGSTGETAETLTWKISRLEKINIMLETMKSVCSQSISYHRVYLIALFCS
jgi:hypothetical protein